MTAPLLLFEKVLTFTVGPALNYLPIAASTA